MKSDIFSALLPNRIELAEYPTQLQKLTIAGEKIGLKHLYVKRDDLIGPAFGGNKTRQLEYLIPRIQSMGADSVIACGGMQSNFIRLLGAAVKKHSLTVDACVYGNEPTQKQGNLLISSLLGVKFHYSNSNERTSSENLGRQIFDQKVSEGKSPYFLPRGGADPYATFGYAKFMTELTEQLHTQQISCDHLIVPVGSCTTFAGILMAARIIGFSGKIWGFSASRSAQEVQSKTNELISSCFKIIGQEGKKSIDFEILDSQIGEGYGIPTKEGEAAIKFLAATEGILLDPVFSGKAFAGLLSLLNQGKIRNDQTVLFLLTGGTPSLFSKSLEF